MNHQCEQDAETSASIEVIVEAVSKGVTLKEIHGISDVQMEGLYSLAYDFYNQGRLDEAEKFFRFLCIYDFYCVDFLMGLAAVYQLKKKYQKAADLYAIAFAQSKSDYRAILYSGQCQMAIGKAARAARCFRMVVEFAQDDALKNSARAYLAALQKGQKPTS